MNEFKFKALKLDRSGWAYGSLVYDMIHYDGNFINVGIHEPRRLPVAVIPETVCVWTGLKTLGKCIDVYEGDKWELCFYSHSVHGYITNQGTVERDKNGMWVCCENPGVNKFELLSTIEDYQGAFEIIGNVHEI